MILKESAYVSILLMLVPNLVYLIPQYQARCLAHCGGSILPCWVHLNCSSTRINLLRSSCNWAEDKVCWSIIHTASFGWGIHVSPDSHSLQNHREDLKLKNLGLLHRLSAYRIKIPFVMHLLLKLNKFKKATVCPPSHVFLSQQQTVWHILQITVVFWGSVLKNAALPTRALRALVVYFWALKEVKTGVVSDCRLIPHQLTGPFKTEICMSHRLHWKILLY